MTDLEYITTGVFTRFVPCTPAGEDAWREMAKEDGCAAVLTSHARAVIAQLKAAGYSVRKAKKPKGNIESILAELAELGVKKDEPPKSEKAA